MGLSVEVVETGEVPDRLEAAGHVRRRPNPADRRSCLVELEPVGRRYVAATYDDFAERIGRAVAGRSHAEMAAVAGFLRAAGSILAGPGAVAG